MKKNILQTFEDFLLEPLSILKKTIISITGIETSVIGDKSISVQTTEDGFQVNVVNSPKAYRLLSSVVYKRQIKQLRQLLNENKNGKVQQELAKPETSSAV